MLYQRVREKETRQLLDNLSSILDNYEHRIESFENFVYMHCVGIQLEKHFSKQRVDTLAGKRVECQEKRIYTHTVIFCILCVFLYSSKLLSISLCILYITFSSHNNNIQVGNEELT